ncbi:MAG: hypothetical protein ABS35_08195 [Kaistia sp. SCN 65-12]|nr:MAG: hypothetical protein ABS35_08195 [Kaistia sp. SCN 65-12]
MCRLAFHERFYATIRYVSTPDGIDHESDRGEPLFLKAVPAESFGGLIDPHERDIAQAGRGMPDTSQMGVVDSVRLILETVMDLGWGCAAANIRQF